jgi:16S rRNA G1207 methylase RsmC
MLLSQDMLIPTLQEQVDEFRATMAAEVSKMTQDVLRLQRERQVIEHQLSELFALLSKQKQIVLVSHLRYMMIRCYE